MQHNIFGPPNNSVDVCFHWQYLAAIKSNAELMEKHDYVHAELPWVYI